MRRTAVLAALAAVVLVWSWLRLEGAGLTRDVLLWAALIGMVPALPTRAFVRGAAALIAGAIAVWRAFDTLAPTEGVARFSDGLLLYYDIALPFRGDAQPLMHGVLLLAIFAFTLAVSLAVAARRPLLAAGLLVAGSAWPATLLPADNEIGRGAVILAAALAIVAGLSAFVRVRQAALAGALVIAAAVGLAGVPAVAKGAFLGWEDWDPYNKPDLPVSVRYVWETTYAPLRWPKRKTVVFRVEAPPVPRYWRAATLDQFHGDSWLHGTLPISYSPVVDPLLPAAAHNRRNWLRSRVRIEALQDTHLVAASVPVDYDVDGELGVVYESDGTASTGLGLTRGTTYTAYSYTPRPSPARLVRSLPAYGPQLQEYLTVQSRTETPASPPFGRSGREAEMSTILDQNPAITYYRDFYEQARSVVGDTTSPYVAAVRLETWFRSGGGFRYDESPPPSQAGPVLIDFVLESRRGYCQHFASAMALMLRYLGIPARVAAGFTSGRYDEDEREWVVTDHDAHTWVEVWFRGFGWLPFDPTPGRGRFDGAYSSASTGFDLAAVVAAAAGGVTGAELKFDQGRFERGAGADAGRDIPGEIGTPVAAEEPSLLRLLLLVVAALAAGIALLKTVVRRARFLTRDPRKVAAACRRQLADFLADQHVPVPASATAVDLGEIVRRETALDASAFVSAVDAARYGPPRRAHRAAREARRELRALERALRGRLSRFDRTRGLLSVRSLGFT